MMKRLATTLAIASLGLFAANTVQAEGADALVKRIQELRATYTTTMGMYDQLRADVEALSVLPNAKQISGIDSNQFKKALTACWEAPIEAVDDVKRNAIDVKRAAAKFKDRTAMRELEDTQTELGNARASVKECKPVAMDAAKPDMDAMNDEAKSALDAKVTLIDQIRILSKHELPGRAKSMTEDAVKVQADVMAAIKTAEVKAKAASKNPFGGGGKSEKKEVQRLKDVEKEAKELQSLIAKEMSEMPKELGETAKQIGVNITNVSTLIGQ